MAGEPEDACPAKYSTMPVGEDPLITRRGCARYVLGAYGRRRVCAALADQLHTPLNDIPCGVGHEADIVFGGIGYCECLHSVEKTERRRRDGATEGATEVRRERSRQRHHSRHGHARGVTRAGHVDEVVAGVLVRGSHRMDIPGRVYGRQFAVRQRCIPDRCVLDAALGVCRRDARIQRVHQTRSIAHASSSECSSSRSNYRPINK